MRPYVKEPLAMSMYAASIGSCTLQLSLYSSDTDGITKITSLCTSPELVSSLVAKNRNVSDYINHMHIISLNKSEIKTVKSSLTMGGS
jgi:hypothetical protein